MRPVRDDSGERDGWWIGERFIPDDNSDLTRRDELICVLEEDVSRLKESLDMWRFSALNREDENSRMRDEIAALREAVREVNGFIGCHKCNHKHLVWQKGKAVRFALEEKS